MVPDFWQDKGRYNQKSINKQTNDIKRWLRAEARFLRQQKRQGGAESNGDGKETKKPVTATAAKKSGVKSGPEAPPPKRRGRPPGAKDKVPRKKRERSG